MPINFLQIPILNRPGVYIEVDPSRAFQGLPALPNRLLILGQRLSTGTVANLTLTRFSTDDQADRYFGRGSMLARMCKAARRIAPWLEMWAIPVDDLAAGVTATGTIAFVGPSTAAGTLAIEIAGQLIQVGVASGRTAAQIATDSAAAINAATELPVTASVATATVTLTARHKGLSGNDIDVRTNPYQGQFLPAGVTATVTSMAGGTGNPDITTVINRFGLSAWWQTICSPWTDTVNLTALETELNRRWGPQVQLEGQAFIAQAGSQAAVSTFGDTRNTQLTSCMAAGFRRRTPPWEVAALVAATDASQADPALGTRTLPLIGMLPPDEADMYSPDERNLMLGDGISTFYVDAGGVCRIERLVTMYQTNPLGAIDPSMRDVAVVRTLNYLRFSLRNRIALRFDRYKLAKDGTRFGPGQRVVTPAVVRDELIALFTEWENAGLVEDFDQFKSEILVERNGTDVNRLDAYIPPNVINQFLTFAGQVGFRL